MYILKYAFLLSIFSLSISLVKGQNTDSALPAGQDTASTPIGQADSLHVTADSTKASTPKSEIETTIKYDAEDSIKMDVPNQTVKLYGNAQITYGEIQLTAAQIEINYLTHIITANGYTDSTGQVIGKPQFVDGSDTYETDDMKYNFDSKKALIDGVVTQQGDAYVHGEKVFKNQFDELYISNARYTTCNLADPHFYIKASKIKVIPNNKVVSGPFNIYVHDIPLPIGFAFGMFPMPKKKASGIIVPSYGEEQRRGFYLKNGGYYFALSDYMDLQLMGEIYTKGSWGLNMATSYSKRYKYSGRLNIRYNKQRAESEGDSTIINDLWINWSHSPKSTGASRFSASVSAGTSSYNQNNPTYDLRNTLNQDFNSSVSYSTTFRGTPFNLSASSRFQQNVNTGVMNLLLPELALNMNRIYPFKFGSSSAKNPLQKISFSWNMTATNRIANSPLASPGFNVVDFNPAQQDTLEFFSNFSELMGQALNGVRHSIPISTSMNIFKYISLSPSFSYNELWYFKELKYQWDEQRNAVRIDTLQRFSRAYSYNTSLSLNTRLYGIKYFNGKKIQAIRHVMIPTAGMSFSPDFSDAKYGYYSQVQIDSLGHTRRLSKYQGFVYGTPSAGQSASAFFSLSNNIEMKVKTKNDTTDQPSKVSILDNLSINSSYNFLADSFKLAPFNISARTRLFKKKLNVNFGMVVNPYIWQLDSVYYSREKRMVAQRRRDIYAWDVGQGLGQITSARLALSMSLNPKARKKENEQQEQINETLNPQEKMQLEFMRNNPELYVDFNIPWNVSFNYNINYSKNGFADPTITQSIMFNGSLTLTDKWNISFNSGFDFQKKQFTQTNFNISRDLHCWQMNFSWTPFGRYESYSLTINAKSSLLQDLKVNKQSSWWDN